MCSRDDELFFLKYDLYNHSGQLCVCIKHHRNKDKGPAVQKQKRGERGLVLSEGTSPISFEFSESTSPGEVLVTAIHISGTVHHVYISIRLVYSTTLVTF